MNQMGKDLHTFFMDLPAISKLVEFIIFIVGAMGVGLFKSRIQIGKQAEETAAKARVEEEDSRQQVVANFKQLMEIYEEKNAALLSRLRESEEDKDALAAVMRSMMKKNPDLILPRQVAIILAVLPVDKEETHGS
jgi:hypothetical protein